LKPLIFTKIISDILYEAKSKRKRKRRRKRKRKRRIVFVYFIS